MAIPPSRTLSWQQLVQEADLNWLKGKNRPWWYEFSNGRTFDWYPTIYTQTGT